MTWPNPADGSTEMTQRVTSPRTFTPRRRRPPPHELLAAARTGPTARNTTPLHRRRDRGVHLFPTPPFSSMSPPAPPRSSARTGASSAAWVAAKGGEEEVAVPRRVQWKADEGACPHLAPTGFDSNLLLPSLKKSEAASTAPSMTD
ncbi:uncharacterized protein LOC123428274 isoform X2 [Hordeum vulgare subsp. vulgare]|nr:uncharacterized protein LOC123428274 isoform X2 [Hordeum vulgare subsp. vulgare]XP_044968404.1 uncharacterized protein LOC123428274 isoform X2 [Hordeum vulgare subsp. vulgare]XP_044968405.1 uncharacterized protein LOC123428274 isoform X2 [Hordeum vulgare subsp. vulgare]XP_044968406.1 uncharacterized protein LOC123428274 isoform X2 [Hordeum vulgare subsp. vulgare]